MSLSLAAYGIRLSEGKVDRKFLEWLKLDLELNATSLEMQGLVPTVRNMLALTDGELIEMNKVAVQKQGKATMLQVLGAPLLDSRVSALWSFETSFQRKLLEIKHHLSLLQDLVERSRKYFDLTFTKLEGDNHRLVSENLAQACHEYGSRAELIVDKIRALVKAPR